MSSVKYETIVKGLREAGLKKGDIVLVHSSFSKMGFIDGVNSDDQEAFFEKILKAFDEVIDFNYGTLVVPTFTHEYARNKEPFIYETTSSEVGKFTEYVRKHKDSLRSLHPIASFSAIGKDKFVICSNVSISCYGINSVFERLIDMDAKMMFFGASMKHMTLKHHMEHVMGLPYVYHKAYFTTVYKDKKEVALPFLCCVRYLNGKVHNNDCSCFEEHLRAKNMLKSVVIGGSKVINMKIKDAYDELVKLLTENPAYLLEEPYYEIN